jgi:hypothetical protein
MQAMLYEILLLVEKTDLLDNVNFLFIPILSVDAHENALLQQTESKRSWKYWMANKCTKFKFKQGLCKLDTREIRAVVNIMNIYSPDLYMDIHVTDGADYQ